MTNQIPILARPDIYGQAAKKFFHLLPSSCIVAERLFLESVRLQNQLSLPPLPPSNLSTPPSPPLLTSSPLHPSLLEKPKPIFLSVSSKPNGMSNPFDSLPAPRSRSGSNGSSSSLVSASSSFSGDHAPNSHPKSSAMSSSAGLLQFEFIPPSVSYMHNLLAAREAIQTCAAKCKCWSNWYDQCREESREGEGHGEVVEEERTKSFEKSFEMEDVDSKKTDSSDDGLTKLSLYRPRASTVSDRSRLPLTRSKETRTGMLTPDPQGKNAVSDTGTATQNLKQSPRFSQKLDNDRFEDTAGLLLKVLFNKLSEMLTLPPAVNVQLTKLISRLAHYPQPLLRSLLLNHQLVLRPGVPNLIYVSLYLCI